MPHPTFSRRQSGFTLIEIAIVLVIIGLLLGGILKGQELINSARVKNLATDFRNIPVFIYGYQDKFRALPAMIALSVAHVRPAHSRRPAARRAMASSMALEQHDRQPMNPICSGSTFRTGRLGTRIHQYKRHRLLAQRML